jgi:hypothetical protein
LLRPDALTQAGQEPSRFARKPDAYVVIDDSVTTYKLILRNLDLQHERRTLVQHGALGHRHRRKIESKIPRQLADQRIKPATPRQRGPGLPARTRDDGRHGTRLIITRTVTVVRQLALRWLADRGR